MDLDLVPRLGERLPLSSRRVVSWVGQTQSYDTPLGHIDAMADGAILVRDFERGTSRELTAAEARLVAQALTRAAGAVDAWQDRVSGRYLPRVERTPDGAVWVTYDGRRRPMRPSKLRGSKRHGFYRKCDACRQVSGVLWVAADELREHGFRVRHCEVCPECVERLARAGEVTGPRVVEGAE